MTELPPRLALAFSLLLGPRKTREGKWLESCWSVEIQGSFHSHTVVGQDKWILTASLPILYAPLKNLVKCSGDGGDLQLDVASTDVILERRYVQIQW